MTLANTLKHAGSEVYTDEADVLAWPIMERLKQDEIYRRLAKLRFVARKVERKLDRGAGRDSDAHDHVWDCEIAADDAVKAYVAEWLGDNLGALLDDENVERADILDAVERYDVADQHAADEHIERLDEVGER